MSAGSRQTTMTRRRFAGALSLCLGATCSHASTASGSDVGAIRPPGVSDEGAFLRKCIRCGLCQDICPERVIKCGTLFGRRWLAPELDFTNAFCPPGCVKCLQACPTAAIPRIAEGAGKPPVRAVAKVDGERCLESQRSCGICVSACPKHALRTVSGQFESTIEVDAGLCVGCGACQISCAVYPPAIRLVSTLNQRSEKNERN